MAHRRNSGRGENRLADVFAAIAEGFERTRARIPPEEFARIAEARRREAEQLAQQAREERGREEERQRRLEWEMRERSRLKVDDAIVIKPRPDPTIRPRYTDSLSILDERTGNLLVKPVRDTVELPQEEGYFHQWQVNRPEQRPIYIVTRQGHPNPHAIVPKRAFEIVLAYPDGFFPFEEALMPEECPMDRIAAMIDIHGCKEGRRGFRYYDNRGAYREKTREWARLRAQCPFRTANLDPNLVERGGFPIYFPVPGGAVYDADTQTVTAPDGSTLHSNNKYWVTSLDRDGAHDRIYATWTDPSGRFKRRIEMIPKRGWRSGYGETRAVVAITRKNEWDKGSVPPPDGVAAPTGEQLADLVNLSVPIAGEHAANMIVIDARADHQDWR
jgi:hypothetical protein